MCAGCLREYKALHSVMNCHGADDKFGRQEALVSLRNLCRLSARCNDEELGTYQPEERIAAVDNENHSQGTHSGYKASTGSGPRYSHSL